MQTFYRLLREGRGRGEALRLAQLERLHTQSRHAHPFFWAPFILMGNWL